MPTAPTTGETPPFRRREAWILAGVWILSALYLLHFVDRGWIPGDDGMLGHTAERALGGELPNVDYRVVYTGGLAMWHSLAFRLLGVDLISIRWFLYGATLLFVPVLFRIARRAVSPLAAAAVTLGALVWGVPNYFSAMPSWYNLYLAAGGLLALMRHVEDGRRRWLALAGICAGASILVKSIGLLFVASGLLFLVYREQEQDAAADGPVDGSGARLFRLFETVGLLAFGLFLAVFVLGQRPGWMELVLHVVPGLALAAFLIQRVWRRPSGPGAARFRHLAASGAVFVAGALLPLGAFAAPYLRRGVLDELLASGFLFQSDRLEFGVWALPGPATFICALPVAFLFAWPFLRRRGHDARSDDAGWWARRGGPALAALAAALLLAFSYHPIVYQTVWFSLRPLVPIVVLSGVVLLTDRGASCRRLDATGRQQLFLVLAALAPASIIQFPYARALYFCYVSAYVVVGWLFVARAQRGAPRRLHAVVAIFYVFFGLAWVNLGWVETMEYGFRPVDHGVHPKVERADELRVTRGSANLWNDVVALVQEHSDEGDYILATPDNAVVYFLADRRNPTPTVLDFLDEDFGTGARRQRLLHLLEEKEIDVVVLRRIRVFTPLDEELFAAVEERYPHMQPVGQFSVHWRDSE